MHLTPDCGYGKILNLSDGALNLTVSEVSQERGVVTANGGRRFRSPESRLARQSFSKPFMRDRGSASPLHRA